MDAFTIRRMNSSEIDIAVDWAEIEGWNPGNQDSECFYATDPNGFLIGLLNNEPITMVSAVAYGTVYGFMGFYITKPGERNRGYAMQMWNEGLRYLGDRPIGLDSVRPDLVHAQKPDFKPAHTNFRFKWIKDTQWDIGSEIVQLADVPFASLAEYDLRMFTFPRESFLKLWISRPGTTSLGVIENEKLRGYGVLRECREGFKIGPLFADDYDTALALFQALTSGVDTGVSVYLDTPEINADAVKLAQFHGMTEVFRTTRMYKGAPPKLPLDQWFGVTTFELG